MDVVKQKTITPTQTEPDALQISAVPSLTTRESPTPDSQLERIVKVVQNMVKGTRQSRQQHDALAKESSTSSRGNAPQLDTVAKLLHDLRSEVALDNQIATERLAQVDYELKEQRSQVNQLMELLAQSQIRSRQERAEPESATVTIDTIGSTVPEEDHRCLTDLEADTEAVEIYLDSMSQLSEDLSDALLHEFYTPCSSLPDYHFEMSSTFFPEQYTPDGPFNERTAVLSMVELGLREGTRLDKYFLLFAKTPRHWQRVTVSASFTNTTFQGTSIASVSAGQTLEHSYKTLPGAVQPLLEGLLVSSELFESVTNVSIDLQVQDSGQVGFDPARARLAEDVEEARVCETSRYLQDIEDIGCPQFLESEIVIYFRISSSSYLVLAESQVCIERKMPFAGIDASDGNALEAFIDDMRLLHQLRACEGVAGFVGVVVDDERKQLKSFLQECPQRGSLQQILEIAEAEGRSLSWSRRQRWVRQIIKAVSDVHARGIVSGCLELGAIGVDARDNIMLTTFKSTGRHWPNRRGYLPPELRRSVAPGALVTNQKLTFRTDIFQLGLVLWLLAEHSSTVCGIYCRKALCSTTPRYTCTAEHSNPVALPRCAADVPAYINNMISICRSENPEDRLPAAKLLAFFPNLDHHAPSSFEGPMSPSSFSLSDRFSFSVNCDECGSLTTDIHYHCNVCSLGDFDICPKCFSGGVHCFDIRHGLIKRVMRAGKIVNDVSGG